MLKVVRYFLLGIVVFIVHSVLNFSIYLVFEKYFNDPLLEEAKLSVLLANRSLILHLFIVLGVTALTGFVFAWASKTKSKQEAVQKSIIWSIIFVAWYLFVGLLNNTASSIFSSYFLYALLVFYFIGPLVFAFVKKLPKNE